MKTCNPKIVNFQQLFQVFSTAFSLYMKREYIYTYETLKTWQD